MLAKDVRDRERAGRTQVMVVDGENEKGNHRAFDVSNEKLYFSLETTAVFGNHYCCDKAHATVRLTSQRSEDKKNTPKRSQWFDTSNNVCVYKTL